MGVIRPKKLKTKRVAPFLFYFIFLSFILFIFLI